MTKRQMKLLTMGIICIGLFTLAIPEQAKACGTLEKFIGVYWQEGSNKANVLRLITEMCDQFIPNQSEESLLAVFVDAAREGIDPARIRESFETFWCLAGEVDSDGYADILGVIPNANCPTKADTADWYVVAVDLANIRPTAGRSIARLDSAVRDTMIWKIGKDGEWFKIRRLGRDYEAYIHASLLAPYRPTANPGETE